jgi:hypothetical protein
LKAAPQPFKFGMVDAGPRSSGIDQAVIRVVIGEQQRPEPGPAPFGIGPAGYHELLAVQAFDFKPQTAIARRVGRIDLLRDDPFYFQGAGAVVKGLPVADLVIAVVQRRACLQKERLKALLPIPKMQRVDGFAIEVEEIKQEKHQSVAVAAVRCILDGDYILD